MEFAVELWVAVVAKELVVEAVGEVVVELAIPESIALAVVVEGCPEAAAFELMVEEVRLLKAAVEPVPRSCFRSAVLVLQQALELPI
jgi:hypothetical protein